jgi:hypothetical protein
MKKSFLILSLIALTTTCTFAGPHDMKPHKAGHKKPPKVMMHYSYPTYHYNHHGHSHYMHYPCTCYDPYCIHRRHMNSFFRLGPNFSIGISI